MSARTVSCRLCVETRCNILTYNSLPPTQRDTSIFIIDEGRFFSSSKHCSFSLWQGFDLSQAELFLMRSSVSWLASVLFFSRVCTTVVYLFTVCMRYGRYVVSRVRIEIGRGNVWVNPRWRFHTLTVTDLICEC